MVVALESGSFWNPHHMRQHPLAVLFVLALALPPITVAQTTDAHARPAAPQRSPVAVAQVDAAAAEVDAMARAMIAKGMPGMAMTVVHGDRVVFARGYGVTRVGQRERIDEHTAFRLASLSKGFAGTLGGLLVERGTLSWDMPLNQQLPTFQLQDAQASGHLTVRDVLAQRTGLKFHTYDRDLEADAPYPVLAAKLQAAPLQCTPGACFSYQNVAFSLFGDIAFAMTGEFYTRLVETRLFAPLEMSDATFGRDGLESSPRWARPHVRARRGWAAVRPKENYYRVPPAAGVNASISDMAIWARAHLGHRPTVLSPSLLADIHAPQVATPDQLSGSPWRRERLRNAQYGTGWRVFDYAGHTLIYHAGAVQGYRGMIALLPAQDIGLVVLWNNESPWPSALLPTLLDRVLQLPAQDWRPTEIR